MAPKIGMYIVYIVFFCYRKLNSKSPPSTPLPLPPNKDPKLIFLDQDALYTPLTKMRQKYPENQSKISK